jgi:hypothetical protein
MSSLEHIDPRDSKLICGLENKHNEIWVSDSYNSRKTNRFVPYRVCEHPAPITFGDTGEFLVDDEWVVCEFGGEIWWAESNRIGNSCVHGGKTQGCASVNSQTGMFDPKYRESSKYIEDRRSIGLRRVSEKSGIFDPDYVNSDKYKEDKSRAGKAGSRENKVAAGKKAGLVTAKLISKPILITFVDNTQEEYMSSAEAARLLGLNGLTLRRLAYSGKQGAKGKYKGLGVKFV